LKPDPYFLKKMKTKILFLIFSFFSVVNSFCQEKRPGEEGIITIQKQCEFLNEVAASDIHHLYESEESSIKRSGSPGRYQYEVVGEICNDGMQRLDWIDAARYCNWKFNNSFQKEPAFNDALMTESGIYLLEEDQLVSADNNAPFFVFFSNAPTIDPLLRSNQVTAVCVKKENDAHQASGAAVAGAFMEGLGEELLAGTLFVAAVVGTGSAVVGESRELKTRYDFTLEGCRVAVQDHPTGKRFIVQEDKTQKKILCVTEESAVGDPRANSENKNTTQLIRRLLKTEYLDEEVEKIMPQQDKKNKEYPAVSSELLIKASKLPRKVVGASSKSDEEVFGPHKERIRELQLHLVNAQLTTAYATALSKKIEEDDGRWLSDKIDQRYFLVVRYRAAHAKMEEIIKVATARIRQCEKKTMNLKGPLDGDITILERFFPGYEIFSKEIEAANQAHEKLNEAIKKNDANIDDAAKASQGYWQKILIKTKEAQKMLSETQKPFLEELKHFRETYRLYQEEYQELLRQLSEQTKIVDASWQKAFVTAENLVSGVLGNDGIAALKAAKETFYGDETKGIQSVKKAKASFEEAEKAAASCFENGTTYFFQEEHQRSASLGKMEEIWIQRIKKYDGLIQEKKNLKKQLHEANDSLSEEEKEKIHEIIMSLDVRRRAESNEVEALRRAVEAVKTLHQAEAILTEATKMEWRSTAAEPSNTLGSDSLYDAFVHKKNSSLKIRKAALYSEKELRGQVDSIYKAYNGVGTFLSQPSFSAGSVSQLKNLMVQLKNSWTEANKQVAVSRRAWNKAAKAVEEARESKVTWAKNILRLASTGTHNFSLGKATKKDGELLGALWVGRDVLESEKESPATKSAGSAAADFSRDEEEKGKGVMSCDGLKRFRPLDYKADFKKYQMNFEQRSAPHKKWNGEEQDGSITWGNGHLTIINPHDEDAGVHVLSLRFVPLKGAQLDEGIYDEKEMQLKAEMRELDHQALYAQYSISLMKDQLRVAEYEQREEKVAELQNEIIRLEKEQPQLWSAVMKLCEKGHAIAPKEAKEWWGDEIERVKIQSQLNNSDGNYELWKEMLAASDKQLAVCDYEKERSERYYRLVALGDQALQDFWKKKIRSWELFKKGEQAQVFYYEASKESCLADQLSQQCGATKDNDVFMNAIQQEKKAIKSWDPVIEKFKTLKEDSEIPEYFTWQKALEASSDAKNQRKLTQLELDVIRLRTEVDKLSEAARTNPSLWKEAVTASKKEKVACKLALAMWKQSIKEIPVHRKDLLGWWEKREQYLGSDRDDASLRLSINQNNEAVVASAAAHQRPSSKEKVRQVIKDKEARRKK